MIKKLHGLNMFKPQHDGPSNTQNRQNKPSPGAPKLHIAADIPSTCRSAVFTLLHPEKATTKYNIYLNGSLKV